MSPENDEPSSRDLTSVVERARRGFRSDVQRLVDALAPGELYVPLALDIQGARDGEVLELTEKLSIVPHMLSDANKRLYCVAFTRADFMQPLEQRLGWNTEGGELKFCTLSAGVAFDLCLQVMDDEEVLGLVINPDSPWELVLNRIELSSIAAGTAVPLVGYVGLIEEGAETRTLDAGLAEPLPQEIQEFLDDLVRTEPALDSYRLSRTFNPERDLEPHFTLWLRHGRALSDRRVLTERVILGLQDKLPPPGYIDILFEESDEGSDSS